jgi:hypothetical protein
MLVMLFFYWRIYRAAIRTTRAINQGFRTTKGKQQDEMKHLGASFLLLLSFFRSAFVFSCFAGIIMHPQPISTACAKSLQLCLVLFHFFPTFTANQFVSRFNDDEELSWLSHVSHLQDTKKENLKHAFSPDTLASAFQLAEYH